MLSQPSVESPGQARGQEAVVHDAVHHVASGGGEHAGLDRPTEPRDRLDVPAFVPQRAREAVAALRVSGTGVGQGVGQDKQCRARAGPISNGPVPVCPRQRQGAPAQSTHLGGEPGSHDTVPAGAAEQGDGRLDVTAVPGHAGPCGGQARRVDGHGVEDGLGPVRLLRGREHVRQSHPIWRAGGRQDRLDVLEEVHVPAGGRETHGA